MMTTSEIETLWCLEVDGQDAMRLTPLGEAVRRNGRELLGSDKRSAWQIVAVAADYEDARILERELKRRLKEKEVAAAEHCADKELGEIERNRVHPHNARLHAEARSADSVQADVRFIPDAEAGLLK